MSNLIPISISLVSKVLLEYLKVGQSENQITLNVYLNIRNESLL